MVVLLLPDIEIEVHTIHQYHLIFSLQSVPESVMIQLADDVC